MIKEENTRKGGERCVEQQRKAALAQRSPHCPPRSLTWESKREKRNRRTRRNDIVGNADAHAHRVRGIWMSLNRNQRTVTAKKQARCERKREKGETRKNKPKKTQDTRSNKLTCMPVTPGDWWSPGVSTHCLFSICCYGRLLHLHGASLAWIFFVHNKREGGGTKKR